MENLASTEIQNEEVECTKAHVHTSECKKATHQCSFPGCGKIFMTKSVLDRHMRVHTGEKPYSCPVCGKTFSQLGNMTKHMKSHETAHLKWDRNTIAKPYKCTFPGCNSSFTAKTSLQSHMLTCHNIMPSSDVDINSSDETITVKRPLEKVVTIPESATVKSIPSQCLHNGCNQVFNDQTELRKHLYSYSPGIHAEHEFLLNTVIQFADTIATWDNKSTLEKESVKAYALSVKQAVQKLKLEIDEKQKSFGNDSLNRLTNLKNDQNEVKTQADSTSIDSKSVLSHQDLMITDDMQPGETDDSTITKILDSWVENSPLPHSFSQPLAQGTTEMSNNNGNYPQPQLFSNLLTAHDTISDGWRSHSLDHLQPTPHSHLHHHSHTVTGIHTPSQAHLSNRFHQLGLVSATPQTGSYHVYHSDPNQPPPAFILPPTAMSWQQAIELSHDMMSGGQRGRPVLINPCSSANRYKDFNFYEQSPAMIPVVSQGYSADNNHVNVDVTDYDDYGRPIKKMKTDNF